MKKFMSCVLIVIGSLSLYSQVPVRLEPRHKVGLENQWIRLLDVRMAPGDTSLFHIHEIPSYFIPLSTTAIGSQVKGQSPQESRFTLGATWYNGFENGPLVHKVWNSDTNVLHVIDLELLSSKKASPPPIQLSNSKVDFENERLRSYKFEITNRHVVTLPPLNAPVLVISLSGAEIQIRKTNKKNVYYRVKAGGFQWLEAGQSFTISNEGNGSTEGIFILLK